jgi:hypothetical protein
MAAYQGSLRIAGTEESLNATFAVEAGALRVTAGNHELGTWPLEEIALARRGSGLYLDLGGENVVVMVPDEDSFAAAITVGPSRRRRGRSPRRPAEPRRADAAAAPRRHRSLPSVATARRGMAQLRAVLDPENWKRWLQDTVVRWALAFGAVIVLALFVVFATRSVGMVLVLAGMVALLLAALAVSEDLAAYRVIPSAVSETALVIAGVGAMAIGALLIVIA